MPEAAAPAECARVAVAAHCNGLIDAVGPACVGVKLQLACFERLGPAGWAALFDVAAHARQAGLLVIADGKRGDVPVTAAAYAQALVGETETPWGTLAGLGADSITVNPLLGRDSLMPFVETALAHGAGVFLLVRTSNPGAADLQDAAVAGEPLYRRLAKLVAELGSEAGGAVGERGLADVGAVVGATAPERLGELRKAMPRAVFLVPGIGAQGGAVEDLGPALGNHPASVLIAASRSIAYAHEETGGDPAEAALAAAERLREAAWGLVG